MWVVLKKRKRKTILKNNKLISKSHQRFKSKKHNVFTEEFNKIVLSANSYKIIQSIHSPHAYGMKHMHMERAKIQYNKYSNII